jgi:hypothetical protein
MSDLIIIVSEQLGNAYSIDSEGTLFSTPLYLDGKVNTNDWDIVENYDDPEVNVIQYEVH